LINLRLSFLSFFQFLSLLLGWLPPPFIVFFFCLLRPLLPLSSAIPAVVDVLQAAAILDIYLFPPSAPSGRLYLPFALSNI